MFLIHLFQLVIANNYITDQLTLTLNELNLTTSYKVQMNIIEFPSQPYCLPIMKILYNEKEYYDNYNYWMRQTIQRVYVNQTNQLTIQVSCLDLFDKQQQDKKMNFNITLNEASYEQQRDCQFPMYGHNCEIQIQQINIDFDITINILNNSWLYAYILLDYMDYDLLIQNENQLFGFSNLIVKDRNRTSLPSFEQKQNFIFLSNNYESILNIDQKETIYLIGIYNFNQTNIKELKFSILSKSNQQQFPLWAFVIVSIIIIFGFIVIIIMIYYYKHQYRKLTEIVPALDRKILKKYMSTKKITVKLINETCSVCLIQFEINDKYCQTPCNHYFHEQCLYDWTIKQSNCPICRFSLQENDIIQSKKQEQNSQQQPQSSLRIPFYQIDNTPIRTQNRIEFENSPTGQLNQIDLDNSPQNNISNRNLCFQIDQIKEN